MKSYFLSSVHAFLLGLFFFSLFLIPGSAVPQEAPNIETDTANIQEETTGETDSVMSREKTPEDKISFSVDYNCFRYSDSLAYMEILIAVYRDQLEYVPFEGKFKADFLTDVQLSKNDSVYYSKKWKNINTADSLGAIKENQRIFAKNHFIPLYGQYDIQVILQDLNSKKETTLKGFALVEDFSKPSLVISDIQIASNIKRDTSKSIYVKNGYRIQPNPDRVYGIGLPILYSYAEIYNLTPNADEEKNQYKISYKIVDSDGQIAKSTNAKIRKKPGASAVEVSSINVVTLVSGPYTYVMEVEDLGTGEKSESHRKFFVYREADYQEGGKALEKQKQQQQQVADMGSAGLDATKYDVMGKKELDKEFDYVKYIATRDEKNSFKKLNVDGKRNFLKEFWVKRDQSPETPINEFKRDYMSRVEYANRNFKGSMRKGYRSDQGRILLIYGQPDEVEREQQSSGTRPYEIWNFYSVQGGVYFVFADRRDMGEMELVHSTAYGELYDDNWTRWIQIYDNSSSNYNY